MPSSIVLEGNPAQARSVGITSIRLTGAATRRPPHSPPGKRTSSGSGRPRVAVEGQVVGPQRVDEHDHDPRRRAGLAVDPGRGERRERRGERQQDGACTAVEGGHCFPSSLRIPRDMSGMYVIMSTPAPRISRNGTT